MTQWAATICAWILLGLLMLTGYAKWAAIVAGAFAGLVAAIVIGFGIAGRVRRLRSDRNIEVAPPAPNLAFLSSPDECPWCSDLNATDADECTCIGKCESITWCRGDWVTAFFPAITEERPS